MVYMRVALCDDEHFFRNELYSMISEYAKFKHISIICENYSSGRELLPHAGEYDIIFMDYQMNDLNGLDTSRKIRAYNNGCVIIFVSAYPEIAMDTFEVNTFRFLCKPIKKEKFFKAMDDYINTLDCDNLLVIKSDDIIYKLKTSEIIYLEAKSKHCIIRTSDNIYEVATHLKNIEKQLPPEKFARCQRSYVAGFSHIKKHTSQEIIFDNGEKADIGKKYLSAFKNAFQEYIIRYNRGDF